MVIVPQEATSGTISVIEGNVIVASSGTFSVSTPVITGFSTTIGSSGLSVLINGSNFSPNSLFNIVKFNGVSATVSYSTSEVIKVSVPAGATSGKVSVTVGPNTGVSAADFMICAHTQLQLSSATINYISTSRNTFTFDLLINNVGSINAWDHHVKAFVSVDNTYSSNDINVLDFDRSYLIGARSFNFETFTANVPGGSTVDDHPYLIILLSTTDTECDTTIGHTLLTRIIP